MRELRSQGMTYPAIAAAIGCGRSAVIRSLTNYRAPDAPIADEPTDVEYWPRIVPPAPRVPAAVALDYRLSPRERALRQHGRVE